MVIVRKVFYRVSFLMFGTVHTDYGNSRIVLHANALIRALVHARDEFNMEDFHILRGNAVVVAATLCPEIIFPFVLVRFLIFLRK